MNPPLSQKGMISTVDECLPLPCDARARRQSRHVHYTGARGQRRFAGTPALEAGQSIVWTAVMLPLLLSVVGLALEAGLVFNARLQLQNVVDAAARAGVSQIDDVAYRASGNSRVVLDTPRARTAAVASLAGQRPGLVGTVDVESESIVVEARREVATSFLRVIGVRTVRVVASARAEPRYGVEQGNR